MRDDDVELVRRGMEAVNRGDDEAVLALLADDVEVYSDSSTGNPGSYRGKDGYLEWSREWLEAWDEFRMDVRAIEPVGDDDVLVTVDQMGKGKGSGIEIGVSGVVLHFRIRAGRATRVALYLNREAAAADLDLG
jgi:ketosteroid isomerase-like protein